MDPDFRDRLLSTLDDLYSFALALAGDAHDAHDLSQEALLRAIRGRASFRPGTDLRAWIFTILRNAYRDDRRRRKLRPAALEEEALDSLPAASVPHAASVRLSEELDRALTHLSPAQRALLFLCDVEGFSYREIAEILGRPVGSVMSGLHYARRRLLQLLSASRDPRTD